MGRRLRRWLTRAPPRRPAGDPQGNPRYHDPGTLTLDLDPQPPVVSAVHLSLARLHQRGYLLGVKSTYTIKELQRETAAAVRAAEKGSLVTITRHDCPVVHVISDERLGALLETMELLTDPNFVTAWQQEKAGKGRYYPASRLAD